MRKTLHIPPCHACESGNAYLCNLTHSQQAYLSEFRTEANFRKGSVIFREGDRPNGLFCIHKGKVKLSKVTDNGREQVVKLLNAGEMIGYRALFAGEEYSASATALEDCEICQLSRDRFFELLVTNPDFSKAILKLMARDIREMEEAWTSQTQRSARSRVAAALLKLQNTFGMHAQTHALNVQLSRQDIADLAGVATETAIRTLSAFDEKGYLCLNGKSIEMKNSKALEEIATEVGS